MGSVTVVSSTLYNMAGDTERPNFLKSSIFSAVMSNRKLYLGETVVGNYLRGPRMHFKGFLRWAKQNNYTALPNYSYKAGEVLYGPIVANHMEVLPEDSTLTNRVYWAKLVTGNFYDFAEQYMYKNYPDEAEGDWIADYSENTGVIHIQRENNLNVSFTSNFDIDQEYLVAKYHRERDGYSDPKVTGAVVNDETDYSNVPDDIDYQEISSSVGSTENFTLNTVETTTTSYSDGSPDTVTTATTSLADSFDQINVVKGKTVITSNDGDYREYELRTWERRHVVVVTTQGTPTSVDNNGVTETTTVTTDTDTLEAIWDYREDYQQHYTGKVVGGVQIYIYAMGGSIARLNQMGGQGALSDGKELYPFIPLRLSNVALDAQKYEDNGLYEEAKSAYKKAFGRQNSYDGLLEQIADNEDVDEIDHAYITFGVPLNTKDNASKRYLYEFFKQMHERHRDIAGPTFAEIKAEYSNDNVANGAPPEKRIRIRNDNPETKAMSHSIYWWDTDEQVYSGTSVTNSSAKVGDYWVEYGGALNYQLHNASTITSDDTNFQGHSLHIYRQLADNSFSRMEIIGLRFRNHIYGGKTIQVEVKEALDDSDDSQFLVPLSDSVLDRVGMVAGTQVVSECAFIVFNSYKVYKKKWWQSGWFRIFIFIAVIIVAVIVNPAGLASATGLLGTNVAVGTALGLTGTAAIVVGAVANALAGMVLSRVLTEVAGEKGAILASIISFVISIGGIGGFSDFSLGSAADILQLGGVLANGYQGWVSENIVDIQNEMEENQTAYEENLEKINKLMEELGGNNDLSFNPLQLTDVNIGNGHGSYLPETVDKFIQRTTMVGGDIVELTLAMIEDFAQTKLELPEN